MANSTTKVITTNNTLPVFNCPYCDGAVQVNYGFIQTCPYCSKQFRIVMRAVKVEDVIDNGE
jgi:hypothetical protein